MDEGSFWYTTSGSEDPGGKRWCSVEGNGIVNNEGPGPVIDKSAPKDTRLCNGVTGRAADDFDSLASNRSLLTCETDRLR